jgi:hypothetical protein
MTKDDEPIRRGDVRHEIQSWWDNANDGREPSDIIAAIPAVKPVVKPLERAKGQDKSAGWTLPMELLCSIKDEIRPSGYGGAVCLEEVEMIALAVEARILAALAAQPAPEVAALVDLVETAQWARNRLEQIADDCWHGDGRAEQPSGLLGSQFKRRNHGRGGGRYGVAVGGWKYGRRRGRYN